MTKEYFIELANYNIWANNVMINWLNEISEKQFNQPIESSFGSIAGNTLHLASTEKIWLDRLTSNPAPIWLAANFAGNRTEIITIWKKASEDLKTYLQNFDESNLQQKLKFKRLNGDAYELPFYQVFAHVFNHSTFHRGQFVTLLRQVGFTKVVGTDLLNFYNLK